tara:strand:+ start:8808 stop:9026 length:219 start_codon:yes stop_codon:yes gene_type:complete
MAKVAIGFVLGFLACVWTYELDATDAFVGFGHKVALACENFRAEPVPGLHPPGALARDEIYWLSQTGGLPPM